MDDRHRDAKASATLDEGSGPDRDWPESRLAQGLLRGDGAAQAAFVRQAHDAVYAFACRCTRDIDRRQDWTHDVILRLLDDLAGGAFEYRRPGALWAWFRKRAWFLVLEANRRQRVHDGREVATPTDDLPERPASDDASRLAEDQEAALAVERCLDGLANRDHARVLRLRMTDDCSYEEIAAHLDAPVNTIRAWIRRGRVALRRCLVHRFGWPLPEDDG
jgi:RNA polymerase sigma-70 factor (ECF subfamily)